MLNDRALAVLIGSPIAGTIAGATLAGALAPWWAIPLGAAAGLTIGYATGTVLAIVAS